MANEIAAAGICAISPTLLSPVAKTPLIFQQDAFGKKGAPLVDEEVKGAMVTRGNLPEPALFRPHPNLSDEINRNICRSEIEGGVWIRDLPAGVVLEVETRHSLYLLKNRGNGRVWISGHARYCPQPVLVHVHGSTWGKTMLKIGFIGRGMHLEFRHPTLGVIRTSRIREIGEVRIQDATCSTNRFASRHAAARSGIF